MQLCRLLYACSKVLPLHKWLPSGLISLLQRDHLSDDDHMAIYFSFTYKFYASHWQQEHSNFINQPSNLPM